MSSSKRLTRNNSMSEVLQFDGFAPDAGEVRDAVIRGQFETVDYIDGAQYSGVSRYPVEGWTDCLAERLGKKIVPRISCFRLNLKGELPHSWVHSDGIAAGYAVVLYLNQPEQCTGGTAFWRHKELKIDRLPKADENGLYKRIEQDWKNLDLWEQTSMVKMEWNRLITYPTALFHSRFPFEGFGTGPEDGRLIWICFYDLAEREQ